jgi:hypothetical protein
MEHIKNYQKFKSDIIKTKQQDDQEKSDQKSNTHDKEHIKSDKKPPKKSSKSVIIPNWNTY